MLISRLSKLLLCFGLMLFPVIGCGTSVDTSPAVGDGSGDVGSSTDGMTEEETEEFEAGEEGG